jgi:hypothetical protein
LASLTEHRCPECGTPFDPNDPKTFAISPVPRRRVGLLVAVLIGSALVILELNRIQILNGGAPLYAQGRFMGRPSGIHLRQVIAAVLALVWLACAARLSWIIYMQRSA